MRRSTLQMLIILGILLPILLMLGDVPTAAYAPAGVTPTIEMGGATPIPVGGHLAMVDRGAVMQATFGSLVIPLAALVICVGIVGFVVMRRRPAS